MRPKRATNTPDRLVATIAGRQHGVISLTQLIAAGLTPREVSRRIAADRLHRIHRGVHAVGHRALTHRGRWMAAVLALGDRAALSHADAARLLDLLPLPAEPGPIHVTVPGYGGRRRRDGIVVHRSQTLGPIDITRRDGIPVTKSARTLVDLRRMLPRERWEEAVDRARFLGLPIGDLGEGDPTRSLLERRFLAICRRHRLPEPDVNVRVGPFLVDFLWRDQRLIVETDGYEHHRSRASFEADRTQSDSFPPCPSGGRCRGTSAGWRHSRRRDWAPGSRSTSPTRSTSGSCR